MTWSTVTLPDQHSNTPAAQAAPSLEGADIATTSPVAKPFWRRLRKPALISAAALTLLLGAGAGTVMAMTKTVTITVDGESQQVKTLAGSVTGALQAAGLTVAEHDSLAPSSDVAITDGSAIAINRGRELTLTIDGKSVTVWTTAKTVDQAMAEIGRYPDDYKLSADRSRPIPLDGLSVTAQTFHAVSTVDGAGVAKNYRTVATTVGALLAEQGIALGPLDTVTPAATSALTDGITVQVTRTTKSRVVVSEALPQLPDSTVDAPDLAVGTNEVIATGAAGSTDVTFEITSVNGKETSRTEVSRATTLEPTGTVTKVGSKLPYEEVGKRVFFHDTEFGVNWDGLAMCESTNNPKAVDPTGSWYGMFQFDFATWATVGGSGNPADAPATEQLMRAKLLYQSRGLEPWLCGWAA
ncbi:DUF348 domain-containing protein [Nakamurella antarctica]|uniref:DUF348 domain-containing protein n=1 Tax=Nakamurella antarctica TaxID=1902245 RepID=A0A3G8ZJ83_9ACTN|nr:resuscitation-promoting factor [Nakamurella antarctica]AZI57333.1 DUF348 domain-containing protein [Nakamurella antarctica]